MCETGVNRRKHTGIVGCGIRLIVNICPHVPILIRRRSQRKRTPFKTQEYCFGTYPVARLLLPTKFHHPPYTVCERCPISSLRSAGTFAMQDLDNNDNVVTWGKWYPSTENLVYRHPQSITIRFLGRTVPLQTEHARDDELWAHPSRCAARQGRGRNY